MSDFFFECKYRRLKRTLDKLGFTVTRGRKHDQIHCENNERKCPLPRHRKIKREVVASIANFILECNLTISEDDLLDLLR